MNSSGELFDVVDEHDRVIGQAPRSEVHARHLRHRAVHIFLFNLRGELFIQKRAASKDQFPGCDDSSASGHVEAGEDYDSCAVRELSEELGLQVAARQLRKEFKIDACLATGWEFVWVYSLHGAFQPIINPAEIDRGEFRSLPTIRAEIQTAPQRFATGFIKVFDLYTGFV